MSFANDLCISIERGDTAGCSFGFRTLKDSYANDSGTLVRTLEQLELLELTVTANPAYLQTQVDVRSCPKGLRSLLDGTDDEDCDCPRNEDGSLVDPEGCDCFDEEDELEELEGRSAWVEMTLLRLELARRK
jgi:hypothetical protein